MDEKSNFQHDDVGGKVNGLNLLLILRFNYYDYVILPFPGDRAYVRDLSSAQSYYLLPSSILKPIPVSIPTNLA